MKPIHWSRPSLKLVEIAYKRRQPGRRFANISRIARDARLAMTTRDPVSYYRGVMKSDATQGHEVAVGSPSHEHWIKIGQMQFDYLLRHDLRPGMRMLEIGCGDLRAGRLFIDYLKAGDYYGVDISPEIIFAAQRTIVSYGLEAKVPHMTLVRDLKLDFLPESYFTVVNAHSVFSHCSANLISECLAGVRRVMAPDGFFDFTFDRVVAHERHVLREDYYYRTETLTALAATHGFDAAFMDDWEELPHTQS